MSPRSQASLRRPPSAAGKVQVEDPRLEDPRVAFQGVVDNHAGADGEDLREMGLSHGDHLGEARRAAGHDPPGHWFREERGEPSLSHLSYLRQEVGVTNGGKATPELLDSADAGGAESRPVVGLGVSKEKRLQALSCVSLGFLSDSYQGSTI